MSSNADLAHAIDCASSNGDGILRVKVALTIAKPAAAAAAAAAAATSLLPVASEPAVIDGDALVEPVLSSSAPVLANCCMSRNDTVPMDAVWSIVSAYPTWRSISKCVNFYPSGGGHAADGSDDCSDPPQLILANIDQDR